MAFNVHGVEDTSGAGQQLLDKSWDVMLSLHKSMLSLAGPLALVLGAVCAAVLLAAAVFPEWRKKAATGVLCLLLGFIFLYLVPLFVGFAQHLGNTVQKGG